MKVLRKASHEFEGRRVSNRLRGSCKLKVRKRRRESCSACLVPAPEVIYWRWDFRCFQYSVGSMDIKGHPRGGNWVSKAEGQEAAKGSVSRKSRSGGGRTHSGSVRYSSHGVERRTRKEEGPRVTTDRPENVQKGKKAHPASRRALGSPPLK